MFLEWDDPEVQRWIHSLPEPPEDWQYGVAMGKERVSGDPVRVWACGTGGAGRVSQRIRLKYANVSGPCLLPGRLAPGQSNART